jgi:hypothetical protein
MILSVGVLFESLDTVLMLQHHVEPDDHQLFELGICNSRVAEVFSDKFAKFLLEGS